MPVKPPLPMVLASLVCLLALSEAAQARFALMPADRVNEVPIERLLANVERNAQGLTPAQQARTIGRLHLLAYLRKTEKLAVYRDHPQQVAEGHIGDCITLDEQVIGKDNRRWPKAKPGEMCEARSYHLEPRREIPYSSNLPVPNAHLTAAVAAYSRAKQLEPDNLRTRLALAFGLDRIGQRERACDELRFVARRGLELVRPPLRAIGNERIYPIAPPPMPTDWETHVVLSEAVAHFWEIATSPDDRRLAAALKERLDQSPPLRYVTPILIPLQANAAFETLIERASPVGFDFTGQGEHGPIGWLDSNAAWLVWDPRGTQKIASGFQLFGSVTWVAFWDNGYLALGALDDDGDGQIAGAELHGLALWQDLNSNGRSDEGEVSPLAARGIVALDYSYERANDDLWISKTGVTFADGEVRPSYDWQMHSTVLVPVKD